MPIGGHHNSFSKACQAEFVSNVQRQLKALVGVKYAGN